MKKTFITLGLISLLGMNSLNASFFQHEFPNIDRIMNDLKQNETFYEVDGRNILEIELPGFTKEEIQVNYKSPYLIIQAENNKNKKQFKMQREYYKKYNIGIVDETKIKVEYINGILVVELPKEDKKEINGTKIEIK